MHDIHFKSSSFPQFCVQSYGRFTHRRFTPPAPPLPQFTFSPIFMLNFIISYRAGFNVLLLKRAKNYLEYDTKHTLICEVFLVWNLIISGFLKNHVIAPPYWWSYSWCTGVSRRMQRERAHPVGLGQKQSNQPVLG